MSFPAAIAERVVLAHLVIKSKMDLDRFLKLYDYSLPPELIANKPASPRDSAKLLVYKRKTKEIFFDTFKNLGKYLPKNSILVLNDTRVLPARLVVKKPILRQGSGQAGGGLARILYIDRKGSLLEFLSDRNLDIGSKIKINPKIFFVVKNKVGGHYFLKPSFSVNKIFEVLEKYGITPIPPYIKNIPLSEKQLRKEYQTVFADRKGSVAAPTASLHFTKKLLAELNKSEIKIVFTTLHVNLGTFSPLSEDLFKKSKLHTEYFEISRKSADILNKAKKENRPIVAVGTTVVRTLESASDKSGKINKLGGNTDIFIKEGYKFRFVDDLITNFHVPKSSLLMLVSAFAGRKNILNIYQKAIKKKFRFFSFGDGMLII
ncbi:MAG: tRNA preQ1(34) S-adenosylmethionine ribosyltransferase-isomerase QueA [Patescibacteria group bacterium]|nr:tRNA preQ1(34) S-adenosylmethionine ribosyltransferase-isomerase QueA [Patescibacteria group bacterium]